jgi:hypothetical protein
LIGQLDDGLVVELIRHAERVGVAADDDPLHLRLLACGDNAIAGLYSAIAILRV